MLFEMSVYGLRCLFVLNWTIIILSDEILMEGPPQLEFLNVKLLF